MTTLHSGLRLLTYRMLTQAEAAACHSTVPCYEDFEADATADVSPGYGSKLAHLYKQKRGAYSAVPKYFICL